MSFQEAMIPYNASVRTAVMANASKDEGDCNLPQVIRPVCPICRDTGSYSYGGSFGGSTMTQQCSCGQVGCLRSMGFGTTTYPTHETNRKTEK